MQCLKYVFFSLISQRKDRVYVKGNKKKSPHPKFFSAPGPRALLDPPLIISEDRPNSCSFSNDNSDVFIYTKYIERV